jgi:tRNA G18 (ribose-2'-O)-methylase SpoU
MLRAAEGVILRIGASAHGTVPARTLGGAAKAKALFLVLGNEERGLTPGVAKNCDLLVRIGPQGRPRIESLNVAQAASVLLYECSGNED